MPLYLSFCFQLGKILRHLRLSIFLFYYLLFFFSEQHDSLKDLIHDLDIWHKSAKLVKALTEVSGAHVLVCGK